MPTFDAAAHVYGAHTPPSLGQLLADAEREGYDVDPVWIVTDMGASPRGVVLDSARLVVMVPIPAPLAPRGTHDWDPDYGVGDAFADMFSR